MRWWIPSVIIAALFGLGTWLHVSEKVIRYVAATVLLPVLGLLLIAIWFIFFTGFGGDSVFDCGVGGVSENGSAWQ